MKKIRNHTKPDSLKVLHGEQLIGELVKTIESKNDSLLLKMIKHNIYPNF